MPIHYGFIGQFTAQPGKRDDLLKSCWKQRFCCRRTATVSGSVPRVLITIEQTLMAGPTESTDLDVVVGEGLAVLSDAAQRRLARSWRNITLGPPQIPIA